MLLFTLALTLCGVLVPARLHHGWRRQPALWQSRLVGLVGGVAGYYLAAPLGRALDAVGRALGFSLTGYQGRVAGLSEPAGVMLLTALLTHYVGWVWMARKFGRTYLLLPNLGRRRPQLPLRRRDGQPRRGWHWLVVERRPRNLALVLLAALGVGYGCWYVLGGLAAWTQWLCGHWR